MEEENEEEDKAYLIKDQKENQEEDEKRADEGEKPLLERVSSKFQTNEDELEETLEKILVEANKGDMLTLNTHHPPRNHEHLSLPTTFHEPPSLLMYMRVQSDQIQKVRVGCGDDEGAKVKVKGG